MKVDWITCTDKQNECIQFDRWADKRERADRQTIQTQMPLLTFNWVIQSNKNNAAWFVKSGGFYWQVFINLLLACLTGEMTMTSVEIWIMQYLAKYQQCQQRLHQEITNSIIPGQTITVRQKAALPYTGNITTLPYTGNITTLPYIGNITTLPYTGNITTLPYTGNITTLPYTGNITSLPYTGNITRNVRSDFIRRSLTPLYQGRQSQSDRKLPYLIQATSQRVVISLWSRVSGLKNSNPKWYCIQLWICPVFFFALTGSETDWPSLEFAHYPILLHNPLYIIQLAQLWIRPQVREGKGWK